MEQPIVNRADAVGGPSYIQWGPIVAGALAAAAVWSTLTAFGSAIGLAVASPSPSWRDTSAALALLSGVWILLVAIGSYALGGYVAGWTRLRWSGPSEDETEFRDGLHGLLVWGLGIVIGALLLVAAANVAASIAGRAVPAGPARSASSTETLLAFELDRLFRTADRRPADAADAQARAEASRILATGTGRRDIAPDDRAYLVRLVASRTGLTPAEADRRTGEVINQAKEAASQARRSAVILAFMTAAALALAAATAWIAAACGGAHRDRGTAPALWIGQRRSGFLWSSREETSSRPQPGVVDSPPVHPRPVG